MSPKVYVLVGMIASGKSTYCKNAAKAGQVIVNDDSIINLIHANEYGLYDKSLKPLYKTIENTIVTTAMCMRKSVVIDRGVNITAKSRKRFIALTHSMDYECEAIILPKEEAWVHAKRRCLDHDRGYNYDYWLKVAEHHYKTYETPTDDEGFSEIHYLDFTDITNGKVIQ